MRKLSVIILVLLVLVGCGSKNTEGKYKIGVLQLADHPSLDATYEGMKEALDELIGEDKYVISYQNANGNLTEVAPMAQKFVDEKVDIIYAIATNAAQGAYSAAKKAEIPVVFNAVTDPVVAGLVESNEKPGNHTTGVSDEAPINMQLALIKMVVPEAKKVGILYNTGEDNSRVQLEIAKVEAAKIGLEIVEQGVTNTADIQLAATELVKKVDALYNLTDNMIVAATAQVTGIATQAGVPVFASENGQMDQGILATESINYKDLGKLGGAIIKEILVEGKKPGDIPVRRSNETILYINEKVAEKLNITFDKTLLDKAVIADK